MPIKSIKYLPTLLLSCLVLNGCQTVVVKKQSLTSSINNDRDSILTRNQYSESSLNVLSMAGLEATTCQTAPQACADELKKIPQISDEQFLATSSELYLAKALSLDKSHDCKPSILQSTQSVEAKKIQQKIYNECLDSKMAMLDQSIRHSYAYLFKTQRAPQERLFDNRQVQIRDFYNISIANLIKSYSERYQTKEASHRLEIGQHAYHVNFDNFPQLNHQSAEKIISTYDVNFSGLHSINRRDGFGSEFLVVLPDQNANLESKKYIPEPLKYAYPNGINPNIHSARYLAATITAQPSSKVNNIGDILDAPNFNLNVHDPYTDETTKVNDTKYPLAANFSAPYGLWLAENNLSRSAYLSLIDRDDRLTMPHLYMMEPYNPNKKVIVLVHGLASSPEAWIRVTNDIMGDPVLRDHYQVWQVFYSTNMPILESHYQIYSLIKQAFALVDPQASAQKDAVLIGHSMGGIISRLIVSQADLAPIAAEKLNSKALEQIKKNPIFNSRLKIEPIPNFSRAIFLSSPHQGTAYADRWFTLAARKIIKLPGAFLNAVTDTLQGDIAPNEFTTELSHGLLQNGPSDLSKNSKFTEITKHANPPKQFKFHSIIGNKTNSDDPNVITDGVVPYYSAHLDGAVSEKIIHGGHSIQETSAAVLELRRILRLHLSELSRNQ